MLTEHFGKFLLIDKIGSGGMAEVFLAKQRGIKGFEKVLAIKRILPNLTQDSEFVSMFINEAKLAALLSHQNIVQIFELGNYDNAYYIAMEYVMGKDLRTVLQQGKVSGNPPSIDQVLNIYTKICSGLDYAHRKKDLNGRELNIVHRDISPQNILVSYEGEIKLVDFGIAKAASQSTQTRAGTIKGKLAYLAPEQAWGRPVDCRTDVFSMGIVLYEMLTGQKLFRGNDEFSILEKVREARVEPLPSDLNGKIAPELEAIILKTLAKDPKDRFQSAAELQVALEDHMHHKGYDFSTIRLSQYLRSLFTDTLHRDTERFRQAEQAGAVTPTEDKKTLVRPGRKTPTSPGGGSITLKRFESRPAARLSGSRRIFRAVRITVLSLILLFVLAVWMARVDFPLVYSLRIRSPTAQAFVTRLAGLPDAAFEKWIRPFLEKNGYAPVARIPEPSAPESPSVENAEAVPGEMRGTPERPAPAPSSPSPEDIDEIQSLYAQVEGDYDQGRLREVEKKLRRIIDLDPGLPKPYHMLGSVLIEQKEPMKALKIFESATRRFPEDPDLHYDLGFLYADIRLAALARSELGKALELNPVGPDADKAREALNGLSNADAEGGGNASGPAEAPSPATEPQEPQKP
jgi:serine/threonine protein kinase